MAEAKVYDEGGRSAWVSWYHHQLGITMRPRAWQTMASLPGHSQRW